MPETAESPNTDLIKLREIIARGDFADLRIFCADLKEDYNAIVGEGKTIRDAALAMVRYFDSRGRINELIGRVQREFPSAEWAMVSGQASVVASNYKTSPLPSQKITRDPGLLRVFLCHASPDKASARELYSQLKIMGIKPWLDEEDLIAGQDWQYEIRNAVQKSDIVLVCISHNSTGRAGFIRDEIDYVLNEADRQKLDAIFVVPLRLEACEVPERIARWHWIDWFDQRGPEQLRRALHQRATQIGVPFPRQSQPKATSRTEQSKGTRSWVSRYLTPQTILIGLIIMLAIGLGIFVSKDLFLSILFSPRPTSTSQPAFTPAPTPQPNVSATSMVVTKADPTIQIPTPTALTIATVIPTQFATSVAETNTPVTKQISPPTLESTNTPESAPTEPIARANATTTPRPIAAQKTTQDCPHPYIVKPGDVLSQIVINCYGSDVSLELFMHLIMKANNLSDENALQAGQKLIIPDK